MNEKFKKYLIPLILFVVSYSIYSVNLDQQGIFIDEVFHHGFSIMYYDSIIRYIQTQITPDRRDYYNLRK